ncbi:MAG TPA: GNAT family N-acetyltransferase [Flavitalea sp.]|nr:GNAT family N-acetyltransferase [Flavitalea sp.]
MENITIRPIQQADNLQISKIIRETLVEFKANHPGTVYYDSSTDDLFTLFRDPLSVYYVAEKEGRIVGGAGIFPTAGLPEGTCELVKMYLQPSVRGQGLGKLLIEKALEFAGHAGFASVYIETMPELSKAMTVYEKFGFKYLDQQLGNSGHFGCKIWMLLKLPSCEGGEGVEDDRGGCF